MYVGMYVYIYIFTPTYTYGCVYIYIDIDTPTYTYGCIQLYVYIRILYICVCVDMSVYYFQYILCTRILVMAT